MSTQQLSVPKKKLKFVLLEGIHPSAVDALRQDGYTQVVTSPKALEGDALVEQIADAHFLGIRSRTQLTADVLAQAPKLTAIGAFCIGTNQIDLPAATRRGVPVFNAPFSNTRSVAELVLAEIIMLMRGIPHKNAVLHRDGWVKSAARSYEVRGKTLGIVGYGHIGTQIGVLAEHMGMSVVFYDIETKLPLGNARQLPIAGRAAGDGRRGDPARAGDPGDAQHDRRAAARPHEAGQPPDQCLARHGGRHRGAHRGARERAPARRGDRRVPGGAGGQRRRLRLTAARASTT